MATKNAKDVYPEMMTLRIGMSAVNTQAEGTFNTNLGQGGVSGGRVMEIVRIIAYMPILITPGGAQAWYNWTMGTQNCELATSYTDRLTMAGTFAAGGNESLFVTSGTVMGHEAKWDIVPGGEAGKGWLVGGDRIYVNINGSGIPNELLEFVFKIFYKIKQVPITEWIGIVQSQSGSQFV